jgi:hypothetical protein
MLWIGCGAPEGSELKVVGGETVGWATVKAGKSADEEFSSANYVVRIQSGMDQMGCTGTFVDLPGTGQEAVYVVTASHCVDAVSNVVRVEHTYIKKSADGKDILDELVRLKIDGVAASNLNYYDYEQSEKSVRVINSIRQQNYFRRLKEYNRTAIDFLGLKIGLSVVPTYPKMEENPLDLADIALIRLLVKKSELPASVKFMRLPGEGDDLAAGDSVQVAGFGRHLDFAPYFPFESKESYDDRKEEHLAKVEELRQKQKKAEEMLNNSDSFDSQKHRMLLMEVNKAANKLLNESTRSSPRTLREVSLSFVEYGSPQKWLDLKSPDPEKIQSICHGDSGGATYVLKDSGPVLVGVIARIGGNVMCFEKSRSTDVREYKEFIGIATAKVDQAYKEKMSHLVRIHKKGFKEDTYSKVPMIKGVVK